MTNENKTTEAKGAWAQIRKYFADFKVLKDNPREYWGMQIVNVVDCAWYFAFITIATVLLSEGHSWVFKHPNNLAGIGMSDKEAGYVMTVFSSAIVICLVFTGLVIDVLGIRKSLMWTMRLKVWLSLILGAIAMCEPFPYRGIVVTAIFLIMAPLAAMMQSFFQVGNKRYSSKRSRGASFNLWYVCMNAGAVLGTPLVDYFRLKLEIGTNSIVFLGVVTALACLAVMHFMVRNEHQVYGPEEKPDESPEPKQGKKAFREMNGILRTMMTHDVFWRFTALMVATLGVRAVYVYMYMLMPKYWLRVIGPDAKIGLLNTINPILIVTGLIAFIPIANKFNPFKQLVFGAIASSMSLFVLTLPWHWFGSTMPSGYYTLAIASMVLVSIGEIFWSPKLYEYISAIAPKGQDATYLGMSTMPWFVAKLVVSALSGHMLTRWCPEGIGTRISAGNLPFWDSPEAMWLVLGIWALSGPLIALFFEKWLTKGADWNKA